MGQWFKLIQKLRFHFAILITVLKNAEFNLPFLSTHLIPVPIQIILIEPVRKHTLYSFHKFILANHTFTLTEILECLGY